MNDISWLFDLFNKNKDKISIIYDNKKYTYLELINNIDYYMIFLKKQNIFSGQIIAINSDYSFQSISLFFALLKNKNVIFFS